MKTLRLTKSFMRGEQKRKDVYGELGLPTPKETLGWVEKTLQDIQRIERRDYGFDDESGRIIDERYE